ncbi:MAG: hypothetical protein NWQ05_07770 [Burkholderiaceae bacterium]|jgi:hypothetical protein|nr:hypothetical protein [Burkholderiaceae bacterium]
MSSEDTFNDKPLADVDEQALAKALDNEHVFERSSAPPALVIPSASSTDEFPDEPEPETEPMPEPEPLDAEFVDPVSPEVSDSAEKAPEHVSSYGQSDPATLAAQGSGELQHAQLGPVQTRALAETELASSDTEQPTSAEPTLTPSSSEGQVLQPHLAHLAQVGLTDSDTWEEQIKPRIEHLHAQIDDVNVRLDHLTTRKYR